VYTARARRSAETAGLAVALAAAPPCCLSWRPPLLLLLLLLLQPAVAAASVRPASLIYYYCAAAAAAARPASLTGVTFEYQRAPALLELSPRFGPAMAGGTAVRVTGSGFVDRAGLSCRVDGNYVVPAQFLAC
jgi:hypothetical protein